MLNAIEQANRAAGMGLWFPCPSEYDATAFLSALSDNLASEVERRFIRNNFWSRAARRLQFPLILVVVVPVAVAIVTYVIRGLGGKGGTAKTIFSSIPLPFWIAVGIAFALLFALRLGMVIWDGRPVGRLVREATALRERIRYTTAMKLGSEIGLSGGSPVTGTLRRTSERSLDERPATVASLVFDFRNLAALIAATIRRPLVIGIDELDKLDDPGMARQILRDIKGIFEITNVYFLVSVSEEAASALHLGSVRAGGRTEFNSSFYTVLELPPLSPPQTTDVLRSRDMTVSDRHAELLCLLGVGNWREILRLAELPPTASDHDAEDRLVLGTLQAEAAALLRQIITAYGDDNGADTVIGQAWRALPRDGFGSRDALVALARSAIRDYWQPGWTDGTWNAGLREPWRRFLIRLFVAGAVIAPDPVTGTAQSISAAGIADLRDVLIMSARSSAAAMLMLESRFGEDLARRYAGPGVGALARDHEICP